MKSFITIAILGATSAMAWQTTSLYGSSKGRSGKIARPFNLSFKSGYSPSSSIGTGRALGGWSKGFGIKRGYGNSFSRGFGSTINRNHSFDRSFIGGLSSYRDNIDRSGLGRSNRFKTRYAKSSDYGPSNRSEYKRGYSKGYGIDIGNNLNNRFDRNYGLSAGKGFGSSYGSGYGAGYGTGYGTGYGAGYGAGYSTGYGSDSDFGLRNGISYDDDSKAEYVIE